MHPDFRNFRNYYTVFDVNESLKTFKEVIKKAGTAYANAELFLQDSAAHHVLHKVGFSQRMP